MNQDTPEKVETVIRIYAILALVTAAILSPPRLAWAPVIVLGWYVFQWKRPLKAPVSLITDFFLFFAISLLLSYSLRPVQAWLAALPVLLLIDRGLRKTCGYAGPVETGRVRRPTTLALTMLGVLGGGWILAGGSGSTVLLLGCGTITVYAGMLAVLTYRILPRQPVRAERLVKRMVAGKEERVEVNLQATGNMGGKLFLETVDSQMQVSPVVLPIQKGILNLELRISPTLAGPLEVKLKGYALDRWGLTQVKFEVTPVELVIIPRARYAEWIARKYLAGAQTGVLPLISSTGLIKPLYGFRRGVEYYGNREYQPGDSLRNIDWKHTYKYNELIVKEYSEFPTQTAVMLINLTARDAEEADKLAYNILATALSLAQEKIPAALAAYNQKETVLTTVSLTSPDLVARALQIIKQIEIVHHPERYLNPPDIRRLKANIHRLQAAESEPSQKLRKLLQLEYRNLKNCSSGNPVTRTLNEVLAKTGQQTTMVILSQTNHDAEALLINIDRLEQQGKSVIRL
jgi:hypothetical protein